jgi:CDP-diacylglycerol--glycerol-3-phosphate 3-phosphatidyltransferase/cardiolipin synthase
MLLYHNKLGVLDPHVWGTLLIYVSAALTLVSMMYYLKAAWPALSGQGQS